MVYLDNAATTRVCPEAAEAAVHMMTECFGNPSTTYKLGREAKAAVDKARGQIAKALGCQPDEVYFTSCGSEGDNWALISGARYMRRRGKHIISSAVEHDAVRKSLDFLEKEGYEITRLQPDGTGAIPLEAVRAALQPDTILVSLMMVNNETGAVNDIAAVARMLKAENSIALLHTDAVQGFLKVPFSAKTLGADMITISGHKIHAPKGTGFLYIRDKVKVKPIIYGGGQQKGMRSGTENVPGVAALGEAAAEIYENFDAKIGHMYEIKQRFIDEVTQIPGVTVNGKTGRDSAPQIVSVTIEDVRSEVMLHSLEEYGIYVSAGSACSSNKPAPSRTLQGIGLPKQKLESTIRISFCVNTTEEEVDYAVEKMKEIIPFRRKFTRK